MNKFCVAILCVVVFFLGWIAGDILSVRNVSAARTGRYKVVYQGESLSEFEKLLNSEAAQGWKLHSKSGGWVIFER